MNTDKKLLILGTVWPEPESSAAGQRMMRLIELFSSANWSITFASTASKSNYSADLSHLGVQTVSVKMNSASFDSFITELKPKAVLFDRFPVEEQFGWRVAEHCPDAIRILDTEDLHCLRRARAKSVRQNKPFDINYLLQQDAAKREVASIFRSDLSLIISEFEMDILARFFGVDISILHYLPFMLDAVSDEERKQWPSFKDREGFVTIGNYKHAPNWDSVQYLSTEIWPLIRNQMPSAEMCVYGAYPTDESQSLHQPDAGFFIEGRAEDAKSVMKKARICLAPLRFGAGLKGKLAEAMQCGTPNVTTPIGAEGMAGEMDWSGTIAETPEEIAQAAVTLYGNQKQWQSAQQQGQQIINQRFNSTKLGPDLLKRVEQIRQNLKTHRRDNFVGAMLQHHTAASTKFMAKWIEEKNRGET